MEVVFIYGSISLHWLKNSLVDAIFPVSNWLSFHAVGLLYSFGISLEAGIAVKVRNSCSMPV